MSTKKIPMTSDAARRIQSQTAKAGDGKIEKGSFAARAMKAAAGNDKKGVK